MKQHYKMFKKGKNWCCMAIATLSVAVGALSISQHNVNADTTETEASSISTNIENTQNLSENTVSLTTSVQNQDLQTKTADASTTQNINKTQGQNPQAGVQTQAQSSAENYAVVSPKAENSTSQSGWQTENGNSYYYRDGQKLIGQQNIDGKDYYFNDQGQQQKDYFLNQNNHTYYFQADGTRLNDGFYNNWGHTYYFQADGSRLDNGFYNNWGHTYYFQADGSRLDDGFYNNWGHTYYFGSDGARWDNRWYNNWGNKYYFGSDGALLTNNFFNTLGVNGDYDVHWANESGIVNDVHYFSQYTPVFAPWGCAGASLAMLLSIKNVYPNLYDLIHNEPNVYGSRNQGWNGGQSGDVTTGSGFDHVIQPNALSNYGKQFYSGINDISYVNTSKIAKIIQSGHPVLYYGWSAYDAGGNRNHCKVIYGYNSHNNTFHVYDPLYGYKGRWSAHSTGGNAYDLGYNAWVPAWHIQSEMSGQAVSIY